MKITKTYHIEDDNYDEHIYAVESQAQGMLRVLQSIMGGYGDDSKSFRSYRKYRKITPNQSKILTEMCEWVQSVLDDNNVDLDI